MNPKEKSLREIINILDVFAIKRTNRDKDIRHLIAGEQFEDLASAIQSYIDNEVKEARAHQEMETYCAMKKKYKSEADFEIHCKHLEKNVLSSNCVYCDLAVAKETIRVLKLRQRDWMD